jgi:hypothetical protein
LLVFRWEAKGLSKEPNRVGKSNMKKLLTIVLVAIPLVACTTEQIVHRPAPSAAGGGEQTEPVAGTVGPDGATIESGDVTLEVPAGAVSEEVQITITKTTDKTPDGVTSYSAIYKFEPLDLVFAKPAKATWKKLPAGSENPVIQWSKGDTKKYEVLQSTAADTSVSASVKELGFGFVAQRPEGPQVDPNGSPDKCLDGQDMDAADVDVSKCPPIPSIPADISSAGKKTSLGAWELGTSAEGENYVYGTLSDPASSPRTLTFDGGTTTVNKENLECWAKGYYRLRKILQAPPAEWVTLRDKGFQFRFFQFQTDLRNGPTGYKGISSFQDHLVKWVTVISTKGVCEQPTLTKFKTYAKSELTRRGIPLPPSN